MPLSIVESAAFRKLTLFLEPNYKPMTSEHAKLIIAEQGAAIESRIKEQLKKPDQKIALTTDLWSSINNESFMAVTVSFIDEEWKLYSPVLSTRNLTERHRMDYLVEEMKTIIEKWGIQNNVVAIVHDNAANIKSIARSINEKWLDFGCAAHTFQICISAAMGLNKTTNHPISKLVNAASKLVGHFHHSNLATQELCKRQELMAPSTSTSSTSEVREPEPSISNKRFQPLKLIQYGKTRWNSIYDMLERLYALRWPVTAVLSDRNVTKIADAKVLDLKSEHWSLIDNLLPILKQLKTANSLLCAEHNVSISCVLPIMNALVNNHLKSNDMDNTIIKNFKIELANKIDEKFNRSENYNYYVKASALDPRYKNLDFLSEVNRSQVRQNIKGDIVKINSEQQGGDSNNSNSNISELGDEELFFSAVGKAGKGGQLEDEVDLFLKVDLADFKTNCLEWWSKNEKLLPRLGKLVRELYCIPATSVASERHFSAAGRTVTKLRNRLAPETTELLLFVHKNNQP